jgi:hypothetical protein
MKKEFNQLEEFGKMFAREKTQDFTCLSYWFPKLQKLNVVVPKTVFIKVSEAVTDSILEVLYDGKVEKGQEGLLDGLFNLMKENAKEIGYPLFLRSGQTSNKHDWKDSCFVENEENLIQHFWNIAEFSQIVDLVGLPINVWVFREIIETKPEFYFFNDMPITTEYRFFFKDKKLQCYHPYWPKGAFKDCGGIDYKLKKLYDTFPEEISWLEVNTEIIAKEFEGYWSVDWLRAKNGMWYVTDMAVGEESYHYPNCKFNL